LRAAEHVLPQIMLPFLLCAADDLPVATAADALRDDFRNILRAILIS
jgi:hypothetical protein